MKKTNFTTIQTSWCLGSNWLRGLIPLFSLFVFALPMQGLAQLAPNCSNFSPSINGDGNAIVGPSDFVTNSASVVYPITVTVLNQWGGELTGFPITLMDMMDTYEWNVCRYLGTTLSFSVKNSAGTCNLGVVNLNGTPGAVLTSAFGIDEDWLGPNADTGKINVYCGLVPLPGEHMPTAIAPCGGRVSTPKVQPDWIMPFHCDEGGDTAEIIFRTWEVYDKAGNLSTLTDTIVVFRLPKLTPDAFVGAPEDSFYCDLEAVPNFGDGLKRYAAWKQPVGLHDYELPYTKLQGITYEIPATIIVAGLINAAAQGQKVLDEYLECEILRKADGTVVTIREIVSGDYMDDLILNATDEQLTYGFLQLLIELNEKPINVVLELVFEFYPYLLLQKGDWVLSEGGNFEQVTDEWFYNSHGESPFWFAGGWPSIYGSGDCISYCDVGTGGEFGCIKIQVPLLDTLGYNREICDTICLPTGVHCGITIKQDEIADWTGTCPQTRGVDSWITQTCWAETPNFCADDAFDGESAIPCEELSADADPDDIVIEYECTDKAVNVHISQWQTLYDSIGPIFDFCYPYKIEVEQEENNEEELPPIPFAIGSEECYFPYEWDHEEIQYAIRAGKQYSNANSWERCNPTVYSTTSHDCAAEVFVPSVKVIDNCSGVHSVKAMVFVNGVKRWVPLTQTAIESIILDDDTCTIYTYSHTSDPIRIPFSGCFGDIIEVRYEANDNCWNRSEWFKYIRIKDDTPPTLVMDREVNVPLQNKIAWVNAETFDEGSWDNCAISLRLARRSDWWADTACVDLCSDLGPNAPYDNWVDLLDDLGVNRTQAITAVGGGIVSEYDFNDKYIVDDLSTFLNEGHVEEYYFHQIVWLWADAELCGKKVVHAWLYALAAYIAENCAIDEHGNRLDVTELEAIFDNLFGKPGYGNELALMGGGWGQAVPFKCEDACEEVITELLVLDYCCNWGKGWSTVFVEDKGNASLVKRLPDLNISCEAYNIFYKDDVEKAAAFKDGSEADTSGAFQALDEAFGRYVKTWVDNQGRPVDIDGNPLDDSELNFDYWNVTCEEKSETVSVPVVNHDETITWVNKVVKNTYLDSILLSGMNGIVGINCAASCKQDVWVDLDDCGQGTITRRFFITGGCGEHAPSWVVEQVINVQSACHMRENMFNFPAHVGSKNSPICLPEALSDTFYPDTLGTVTLKAHLEDKLCNSIAIGKKIRALEVLGNSGMTKYIIDWTLVDWCAPHASADREIIYSQEVIARIDPDCEVVDSDTTGDISLVQGKIETELGEAIRNVEIRAVLGSGSPLTTLTGGEGTYSFSINSGSQVSLIPGKNTGFANGVSTKDLIDIQRHVLQKKYLDGQYRKVAADVNGNGSIDGLDVLELRKLVMKPDSRFVNNTSWRFFDTRTGQEVYDVNNLSADMTVNFVGVKIGDVDMSGDPARGRASSARGRASSTRSSRSTTGDLHLNIADKTLKAGETYHVEVTSDNFVDIAGMQYTLNYVTNLVEIESIVPGALNITQDNYVRYAPGVITSSWSEADGQSLSGDAVLFTMVLKAKTEVQLRDVLSLNSRVTAAEAYGAEGALQDVSLRFDGQDSGFALYQNTPNPYAGQTVIGFKLPEASKATLSVYDVTGKLLKVVEGEYNQGYNEVKLKSSDLNATGVLYYQLDTKAYTATKKMIVIE